MCFDKAFLADPGVVVIRIIQLSIVIEQPFHDKCVVVQQYESCSRYFLFYKRQCCFCLYFIIMLRGNG